MAEEEKKSIEWYRNELKVADEKVKTMQLQLEEMGKTILQFEEEVVGLNVVIDVHYSNEELAAMLKECKDGRLKLDAKLEKMGKENNWLRGKVREYGGVIINADQA